ncbi:PKD domain-containing protein [Tropheryma whipplei]|uniref:PKD domain-containing protein n=1 Tax=Tropheryma whipplei TaxID=2039 RepID=UPI0004BB7615|nr:PKD domain-containing protein [Tropheryma whipplei]
MFRKTIIPVMVLLCVHSQFFSSFTKADHVYADTSLTPGDGEYIAEKSEHRVKHPRPNRGGHGRKRVGSVSPSRVKPDWHYVRGTDTLCAPGTWGCAPLGNDKPPGKTPVRKPIKRSISIRDLYDQKRIAPPPPTISVKPYALVRRPVDITAIARSRSGTFNLLGDDFDVRIYPVRYSWTYGDGYSDVSYTNRASHVYGQVGNRIVTLRVFYRAKVNWGTGWEPAIGEIFLDAQPRNIDVFGWKISLFADNCYTNPFGQGC